MDGPARTRRPDVDWLRDLCRYWADGFDWRAQERELNRYEHRLADVDGVTWYRLRAGPFEKRADAERVLSQALAQYPRAWLATGDEAAAVQGSGEGLPQVERIGSDPPLDAAALNKLVGDARAAMNLEAFHRP
mgnify:CR=1 FL=1